MNQEQILKLIEEKGPELAEKLKIATGQVYEKVLWYVRVDGILKLIQLFLTVFFIEKGGVLLHKFLKKNGIYDYPDGSAVIWWAIYLLIGGFIIYLITEFLIFSTNQLLNKL